MTHLIWPESAFPFILSRDPGALARDRAISCTAARCLSTGAARMEEDKRGERPIIISTRSRFSTAAASCPFATTSTISCRSANICLLETWLRRLGVTQFVQFPGGFDAGVGSDILDIPGLPPAMAMVCYEAIFTNEWGGVRGGDAQAARWMLNVTDDAWFGMTAGPYQHFAQARLRAVEWGLPLVRVANTGVSAIVDARGRIVKFASLGSETVLDGQLPGALPATWQARWGSTSFGVGLGLVLILISDCESEALILLTLSNFTNNKKNWQNWVDCGAVRCAEYGRRLLVPLR